MAVDSESTENLWGLTEMQLPATLDAIEAGIALGDPIHQSVLRRLVALVNAHRIQ